MHTPRAAASRFRMITSRQRNGSQSASAGQRTTAATPSESVCNNGPLRITLRNRRIKFVPVYAAVSCMPALLHVLG